MKNILKQVRKGAGYLQGYGDHPGTPLLVLMTCGGALAGMNQGFRGIILGAVVMFIPFGFIWCIGCISRASDYDRSRS
jgi:hypothetical protein